MGGHRGRWGSCKLGRWHFTADIGAINLLRPSVCVDGPWTSVAVSYGNGNSDPVFSVDLDLSGTRPGRAVAEIVWWLRERRDARP